MPNQYKNKVVYGDSVLMDITDTTAEAGDVASGAVFYAKNGARTVGTFTQAQSDWEEDDTTDPAFILNKPPVIAGEADGSIVSGKLDPTANTVYTLTITGDANSNVFTYTTEDTLPTSASLRIYGLAHYLKSTTDVYKTITKLDATNHLITLSGPIDVSAIANGTLTIYYQQHRALGKYSKADGQYTYTTGDGAHAEGGGSKALGQNSHAEGIASVAGGAYSHAEGNESLAMGVAAHAEGGSNAANGRYSHAEGYGNIAASDYQHVHGKYNTEDPDMTYIDIVGNGTSSKHSNAYTLDWSGNGWFAGKVSAGTVDTPASVANANDLTTKEYVDNTISNKQGKAAYGSTNSDDSDYISPSLAILYITDDHLDLVMSHIANVYGQLFFNSWNVAWSAGLIVSNVILYNNGLLCATLIGNIASNTWIFTVYPIQDALTIDTAMSSTSTNPVQNKVIQGALDGKVNKVSGKGLSTNDYTTAEKNKLAGIEAGAQVNPTIDTVMSSSSTNPVTNSAITTAIANSKGKIFYGQVDSTSTATAFTAQIPGITAYEEGLCVILKNGVIDSASGFTININGLGALPSYSNLSASARDTTLFHEEYTMMFIYEERISGGNWLCYRGYDANTNTIGYQLRSNSMTMPMKSITYRYRLLFTAADDEHFVPATNSSSTNATASRTVCQDPINPFGDIRYYGTTASVAAGSRPSAANLWEQYVVSLGYSFNRTDAALTLSSWKPVYVKCAPQADGSAIMDATTPYVQDLPTTADGKIYIFLGVAYSATNIELVPHHPVYCYRNGGIQEWTGIQAEIDTINTRIDGCVTTEELDDALANLPSGGGSTAPTLLGNTPVKLTEDANIKLNTSGSCTYTLESDTVADFDILNGTTVKATITFEDDVYKLKAGSDASAWYNTYIDIYVDGLTVGTAYTFVFDADGCTFNTSQHITVGHYILYDNSGNTLVTRGSTDSNSLNSYAFTASTTRVKLRWYPSINSYYSAGVSVATVNRIYINKAGTTEHTSIVNSSGSFTDTVELGSVSRGITISSTPVAAVYKVASSGGGSSKPLEGKTIVVFGDSLIGMYRGETSATSYIKNVTGATVYNVGFGGCRMATHPTNGYAQFSMWALADAVASGVWTSQDQYASSGSDYFAEQLATLKSIDFNNVDYVVIHYGTNDFGGGVPLGLDSSSTDCTTFCGAARHSIETLLSAYPKLRIYISLPVYRYWESGGVITYAETYQNSQNVILLEYISALTTIAGEYYLPIIDGYHELGINRLNASTFLSDGTHHNAIGRRRFGEFIGSKIISSM